jgi:site-specific DNA recombinase
VGVKQSALRLDAYIRVSKVAGRSGESFISPEVQREHIESWAKLNGALLNWHEPELDVSGGPMRRPVFDQVMERVRRGETGPRHPIRKPARARHVPP